MIAPIIIGSIFMLTGILLFVFMKKRRWVGLVPFLLGAGLFYIFMWGPLKNSVGRLKQVISIPTNNIREIQIIPTNREEYDDISLVRTTLHIKDSLLIARLNTALHNARIVRQPGNDPHYNWACAIAVVNKDNTDTRFELAKEDNVSVIKVYNGFWYYGAIRADEFGKLIEETSRFLQ